VIFRVRFATSPPDQHVELVSRNSDKCLDVFGGSADAAAPVIQWTCHGGPNQPCRLEPAGGGAFRIIARHSGAPWTSSPAQQTTAHA
jgi:Ricin-type beta-trefoil lectin domain-like